jgi:hypothetical protein
MQQIIRDISHIGDILAIPLFFIAIIYFYQIKNKSIIEYILLLFATSGLILDVLFTIQYFNSINAKFNNKSLNDMQ